MYSQGTVVRTVNMYSQGTVVSTVKDVLKGRSGQLHMYSKGTVVRSHSDTIINELLKLNRNLSHKVFMISYICMPRGR